MVDSVRTAARSDGASERDVSGIDVVETVLALVERESPSGDEAAIAASADLVSRLGSEILGVQPERVVTNGVHHLRWAFGERTRVLLIAHHDTVWPIGTIDRLPRAVRDGILTGPGCFDMKTGLAMALHAVAALPDRSGVTLLVTGDEELGSPDSRALIESSAAGADAALVLEASADGGALKVERKGVSLYELVITGSAAHAGLEPEKGVNATVELARQVLVIDALSDAERETSVTVTVARSGVTTNTVPSHASVMIDVRARTAAEQHRIDDALRNLHPSLPGAGIELRGGINRLPLEAAASSGLFRRAVVIAQNLGLEPLRGVAVGGASDGNFTAAMGIPTLDGLGAVGGGAHAEDEHVIVVEIEPRTRLLAALIDDILARAEEGGPR